MLNCLISFSKQAQKYENLKSIILPAFAGQMEILPGHTESFLLLSTGEIFLNFSQETKSISIESGECHIQNDLVTIIL